jgi:tetratricopeptide (TPR) repeat protein
MSPDATSHAGAEMDCDQISKDELAEKYLLGHSTEAHQEAYERHYFECPRCFDELQAHQALQTELRLQAAAIRAESLPRRVIWGWRWAAVAAMIGLVVGLAVLELWQTHGVANRTQAVAKAPPPSPAERVPSLPSLSVLAVEPPPYALVTLRGSADEATKEFQSGMRRYLEADYAGAIRALHSVLKIDPDAIDARFFLGISYLMTEQTDWAIEELRRTAALGNSPYLEGAHFYLAKAYLRTEDLTTAEYELKKTTELHGSHEIEAVKLLQQLQVLHHPQR